MSKLGEFTNIKTCWICLTTNYTDGITLHGECYWSQIYSYCFGVNMIAGIPKRVCSECVVKLKEFTNFKETALRSDQLWKGIFQSSNAKFIGNGDQAANCQENNSKIELDINSSDSRSFIDSDGIKDTDNIENVEKPLSNSDSTTFKTYETNNIKENDAVIKIEEFSCYDNNDISRNKISCCSCKHEFDTEKSCNDHLELCLKSEDDQVNASESFTDAESNCNENEHFLQNEHDQIGTAELIAEKKTVSSEKQVKNKKKGRCKNTTKENRTLLTRKKVNSESNCHANEHFSQNEHDQIEASESFGEKKTIASGKQVKKNIKNKKKSRCKNTTKENGTLRTRKKLNNDNRNFSCDIKSKNESVINDKRRYTWKTPKDKSLYIKKFDAPTTDCGLCKETFKDPKDFNQHLTEHGANNDLCCKVCDYKGRDFADMVSHRIDHLSNKYKIEIKCHLCNKIFRVPLRLQFHYRSVHLNQKGGKCTTCGKEYIDFKKWVSHERIHYSEGYICDICGKRYLIRSQIIEHIRQQHGKNTLICDICGTEFKRIFNLKQHIMTRHHGTKVQCTHCDKIFKNEVVLKSHLRDIRSLKPYKCDVCSKCYRNQSLLKAHMIWHTDDRKFSCGVCGVAYKTKQCLTIHMLKHSGFLPHKCELCTACFATTSQLKIHMSIHTGVRRNKCPHCPRSFHGKKFMLAHIHKRHGPINGDSDSS